MPEILNPFTGSAFDLVHLTKGINKIPNNFGLIRELGIFSDDPVRQNFVGVEQRLGLLNLLPTAPRGGEPTEASREQRTYRQFEIPHIPHDDVVLPSEVQGVRQFGSADQQSALGEVMARKLATARAKHAITLEHMRAAALRGLVLDADASTIFNWFTEFGITEKVVDFNLGVSTTKVMLAINTIVRHIELNLKGETMNSILCLCSPEWWDAFTTHDNVEAAYNRFQDGSFLRDDMRSIGFKMGRIIFKEYQGSATDKDGNVRKFVPADEARAFPLGTTDTFLTHFGPGNFMDTVGSLGEEVYARQEPRRMNSGTDIHTESNPLAICRRPEVLVKVTKS